MIVSDTTVFLSDPWDEQSITPYSEPYIEAICVQLNICLTAAVISTPFWGSTGTSGSCGTAWVKPQFNRFGQPSVSLL